MLLKGEDELVTRMNALKNIVKLSVHYSRGYINSNAVYICLQDKEKRNFYKEESYLG